MIGMSNRMVSIVAVYRDEQGSEIWETLWHGREDNSIGPVIGSPTMLPPGRSFTLRRVLDADVISGTADA